MTEGQFRQENKVTNPFLYALELGYYAGLIWGAVRWIFYTLKFTRVVPGFLMEPFFKHEFLVTAAGQIAGWLSFIAFSVIASLIYVFLFRKLKGPWPGIIYGVIWWIVLYIALNPWLRFTPPVKKLTWDTNISEFCIFILWGLFIGYTAAQEFTDERMREPKQVTG
ncbi:YqhR family membrane protein [Paenibacillus sp. FSL K6-1566]|uniref:YqhR family membrane protein n=1 Tax=Paenibacillus sp. FSL K6-1566 TaxID=2954515 RepID=UPI003100B231